MASDLGCTISGGIANFAGSGQESTVGGGRNNTSTGLDATFAGGKYNMTSNDYAVVGGGLCGTANGSAGVMSGGRNNVASGDESPVDGGLFNTASNVVSTVAGGIADIASNSGSTVAGGNSNTAAGICSAVGGGGLNHVSGDYACIPGGQMDTVIGDNSMAFGKEIYVNSASTVVFFDGSVSGRLSINRDGHDGLNILPLRVGTSTTNGNGAYLSQGGTWTNGFSRTFKEGFRPLDGKELLEKVSSMPVEAWRYKETDKRHIGPVAEDFVAAFAAGAVREVDGQRENHYLAASYVAGVALIGVKEPYRITQELNLKTGEIELLKVRLPQLEALVEAVLAEQDGSVEPKVELGASR